MVYWFNINKTRKNLSENYQKNAQQQSTIKEILYF